MSGNHAASGAAARWRPMRRARDRGPRAALCVLVAMASLAFGREAASQQFLDGVERVFVGRVIHAESEFVDDGRLILTRYRFALRDGYGGSSGSTVEIVEYGGTVGDVTLTLSHGVEYRVGSTYLVFAERDESGRLRTRGGSQGRFQVAVDGAGLLQHSKPAAGEPSSGGSSSH